MYSRSGPVVRRHASGEEASAFDQKGRPFLRRCAHQSLGMRDELVELAVQANGRVEVAAEIARRVAGGEPGDGDTEGSKQSGQGFARSGHAPAAAGDYKLDVA
jgi:hypothetical protein